MSPSPIDRVNPASSSAEMIMTSLSDDLKSSLPVSVSVSRRHAQQQRSVRHASKTTASSITTACLLAAAVAVIGGSSATTGTTVVVDAFVLPTTVTVPSQRSTASSSSYYRQGTTKSTTTTTTTPTPTIAGRGGVRPLFYAMPDIGSMKANEMKHELESYGINTKSLFDKRDFEAALMEARRDYEQTIKDVMGGSTTNGGYGADTKKKARSSTASSSEHHAQSFYDRTRHQSVWNSAYSSSSVNGGPNGPGPHQYQQQQYRAYNGGAGVGLEEDPLNRHEQQYRHYQQENPYYQESPHQGYYNPSRRDPYDRQQQQYGAGPPPPPRSGPRYDDPAVQMKYHQAMQKSHGMKVDDMQKELNDRGISTKFCMVFADFCQLYAEAIAEDRRATNNAGESYYEEDYDPTYKDVVMQKYDPSQLF
jgi:predicted HTH domain antitoxin